MRSSIIVALLSVLVSASTGVAIYYWNVKRPIPVDNSSPAQKRKKIRSLLRTAGLKNLGNTCYMNSILQALATVDIDIHGDTPALIALNLLLTSICGTKSLVAGCLELRKHEHDQLAVLSAAEFDADEFLRAVLSLIAKSRSDDKVGLKSLLGDGSFLSSWNLTTLPFDSLQSCQLVCTKCHRNGDLRIFTLPIKTVDYVSIISSHGFDRIWYESMTPELLEDYRCECGKYSTTFKINGLLRLPDILVIHFARLTILNGQLSKSDQIFDFPLQYKPNLSPPAGLMNMSHDTKGLFNNGISLDSKKHFELKAVVEHLGGAASGHYICYRRVFTGAIDDPWLCCSDDIVTLTKKEYVLSRPAYLLFYQASK